MLPKFRIWNKEEKYMKTTPQSVGNSVGEIITRQMIGRSDNVVKNDYSRYVVMMGTGLKDKNGKEIFEGDIVKVTFEAVTDWLTQKIKKFNAIGRVVFLNKDPQSGRQMSELVVKISPDDWVRFFNCTEIEVLGNIYENPELLKEVKE